MKSSIEASFVIVTPMFLGGAPNKDNQIQCAETLSASSVKGALRTLYRAINWARLRSQCTSDAEALSLLHQEESEVFGSAAEQPRQSGFLLRVVTGDHFSLGKPSFSSELQYLLGMGLYHHREGLLRKCILEQSTFTLRLLLKPSLTSQQQQQLLETVELFGLIGNLGSRARKGFGSVSITHLSHNGQPLQLPNTVASYIKRLTALLTPCQTVATPPFSAFSRHTKMQAAAVGTSAIELLEKHGKEMALYRSFGRRPSNKGEHITLKQPAEQNFKDDHDLAYRAAAGKKTTTIPRRAIFGLPHPYNLASGNFSADSKSGRRASPLWAHVQRISDSEFVLVHTVFHALFLPNDYPVVISANNKKYELPASEMDWRVIDTFMNRFTSKQDIL